MNDTGLTDRQLNFLEGIILHDDFMKEMKKAGYKYVAVNEIHPMIKQSGSFHRLGTNNRAWWVIGGVDEGDDKPVNVTGPKIRAIVKSLNIAKGCGNSHQHQIKTNSLIIGAYTLIENKWETIK
jgi:hypothetical protein